MSSTKFQRNIAIVVGINNYQDGIPSLKTPVNDAQTLAKILATQHGYETHLLLNQEAERNNLISRLEQELPKKIGANDRLLFYFAGHGIALNGEEGPEGYLIPQDARLGDVNTYLPMTQVHDALHQLPCPHFLGILDCCFAGTFRWSSTRKLVPVNLGVIHKERFDRFIQDPAWQVITSAAHDQAALDAFNLQGHRGQSGEHSPFAMALIEALEGKADAYPPAELDKPAGDGVITATELYLYLRDRVEIVTEAQAIRQTPGIHPLKKHDKGEYIFLTPGHELNLPPAPPLDESQNPYRGLQSFEEEHSELFFGRTELVEKLKKIVKTHPLTVVLGASGSGKSSLVKAGLIPRLKQDTDKTWCVLSPIRPGENPFQALNQALIAAKLPKVKQQNPQEALTQSITIWAEKNPNAQLLIFIDQSEEIITLCQNEDERKAFFQQVLEALKAHQDKVRVVLSLRSDFEPQVREAGLQFVSSDHSMKNTVLKKRWQRGRFIVPAMTRGELREAIEKPAEARVVYFQPYELVEQLIEEVADMPGALPLLSFALSELYLKYLKRQRESANNGETIDRALTETDYNALGGVIQSLTRKADEEYVALENEDAAYAQTIRHVMLRMVALGGGELARRRVPLSELEYPPEKNSLVKDVVDRFTKARLLVKGDDAEGNPYVEPAHDALVRGWQKLLMWKQEDEESLLLQRRLTPAAEEWKSQQQTRFLWNANARLDLLKKVLNSDENWLNKVEAEFVRRSVKRKQLNSRGRWSGAFAAIGVLSLITIFALQQLQRSERRRIEQTAAAAAGLLSTYPLNGLITAISAVGQSRSPWLNFPNQSFSQSIKGSLFRAVEISREKNLLRTDQGSIQSVAISADGQTIISGGEDGTVKMWNSKILTQNGLFKAYEGPVRSLAISEDGQMIFGGSEDGTVKIWNRQGEPQDELQGKFKTRQGLRRSAAISADGQTILNTDWKGTVKIWNLQGKLQGEFKVDPIVSAVAISADGQTIISGDRDDSTVRMWNLQGKPQGEFKVDHIVSAVAISADGRTIISGGEDGTVKMWNRQGEPQNPPFKGHQGPVRSVSISTDGKTIISGGDDGTVRMWDSKGQPPSQPLIEYDLNLMSLDSIDDLPMKGESLVIAAKIRDFYHVRIFDSTGKKVIGKGDSEFSPDEILVQQLEAGLSREAIDNQTKRELIQKITSSLGHTISKSDSQDNVYAVAISKDGQIIVSGSGDGTVRLWNRQRESQGEFEVENVVESVAISADGETIVSGSRDGTVRLWNRRGEPQGEPFQGHQDTVYSVAISADGETIISGSKDGTVRLWNRQGDEPQDDSFKGHQGPVRSVSISTDGETIVSGSEDNTVRIWNRQGEPQDEPFQGHQGIVYSVAISADGETIISGSRDGTVRMWNRQGEPQGEPFQGHQGVVYSVVISADGETIVSGSGDGTVRTWDIGLDTWLRVACNRLRDHPFFNDNDPQEEDEAKRAKETCEEYI